MKEFKKLMEKKGSGKELDPTYKKAKMSMLEALRGEMSGMMKDEMQHPSLKKVTVASDSPEGLQKGLEKAQELAGSSDDDMGDFEHSSESPEEESAESPEEEASESPEEESSELSDEDMAQLEHLLAKAKAAKGRK